MEPSREAAESLTEHYYLTGPILQSDQLCHQTAFPSQMEELRRKKWDFTCLWYKSYALQLQCHVERALHTHTGVFKNIRTVELITMGSLQNSTGAGELSTPFPFGTHNGTCRLCRPESTTQCSKYT